MIAIGVVEHDDAFHARPVHQQREIVGRAFDRCRIVVLGDGAADDDARLAVDASQYGIEDFAANVVKVDVHTLRAMLLQAVLHAAALVVDAGVEAQFVHHVVALSRTAGNTYSAAAFDSGHLPDGRTHRPGGTGNNHGFARFRLTRFEQAEIGGHARHAQYIQPHRQGRQPGVDLAEILAVGDAVILHVEHAADIIAHCELRML